MTAVTHHPMLAFSIPADALLHCEALHLHIPSCTRCWRCAGEGRDKDRSSRRDRDGDKESRRDRDSGRGKDKNRDRDRDRCCPLLRTQQMAKHTSESRQLAAGSAHVAMDVQ